jgi:hypothetical protein
MYGTAAILLLRLIGIIHSIKISIQVAKELPNSSKASITDDFCIKIRSNLASIKAKYERIEPDTILQASNLLVYFNSNRMILAGYELNLDGKNLDEQLTNYLENKACSNILAIAPKLKSVMRKVLLSKGREVYTSDLNAKYRLSEDISIQAFEKLQNLNLGKICEKKQENNRMVKFFKKISISELEENLNLLNILHKLDLTGEAFKEYSEGN